jgi:hypothetical protein
MKIPKKIKTKTFMDALAAVEAVEAVEAVSVLGAVSLVGGAAVEDISIYIIHL